MKFFLVLLCGLVTGYLIYPYMNENAGIVLTHEGNEKLTKFIDREAKQFALAEDAEAKLKAADAMYGKMMILFMAELGLKTIHPSKAVAPCRKSLVKETPAESLKVSVVEKEDNSVVSRPIVAKTIEKKEENKKTPKEEYDRYRTTPYVDSLQGKTKRMIGIFKGTLVHKTAKNQGRIDSIYMNFNLRQENKVITGSTIITMTDPQNVEYSRNAGSGGNRALKRASNQENEVYVEASPTSYFLLDLKNYPRLTGEYFEKDKLIGPVKLFKIENEE